MSTPLFPSEWSKIWIRGTFINLDGTPMAGQVSFAANVTGKTMVASAAKKLIAARPLAVTLDGAGYFQIQIPATNDPDITPLNFTYTVAEPTGRTYSITVPWNTATLSAPGDPLDGQQVIDLTSVVPSPGASGGVGQLLRGVGIQSIVNNPSGGLLVTYTDGASSVVSIPDAVKGDKGDPGEPGQASTVPGPQGPPGEVSAAQLTSAIAALPFRADNTTTTGAAVGTLSALRAGSDGSYTLESIGEEVRDVIGAALIAGTNVAITPNDAGDTITISATGGGTSYTDEQAQDAVAALIAAGTHSGITFTYDDVNNRLSATVTGGGGGSFTSALTQIFATTLTTVPATGQKVATLASVTNLAAGWTVMLGSDVNTAERKVVASVSGNDVTFTTNINSSSHTAGEQVSYSNQPIDADYLTATTYQQVTGGKDFRGPMRYQRPVPASPGVDAYDYFDLVNTVLRSRAQGGGGIVAKSAGDQSAGLIDWIHAGTQANSGYLVHFVHDIGKGKGGLIGLGVQGDSGGTGLLIAKDGPKGIGLMIDQKGVVTDPSAVGARLDQYSRFADAMRFQAQQPGVNPLFNLLYNGGNLLPWPDQVLSQWQGVTPQTVLGFIRPLDGALVWQQPVIADATKPNVAASLRFLGRYGGRTWLDDAGSQGGHGTDTGPAVRLYALTGSQAYMGALRMAKNAQALHLDVSNGAHRLGMENLRTVFEAHATATRTIGVDQQSVPLTTPTGVSVAVAGTPGSTVYGYRVAAVNAKGVTIASATVQTTTGAATLTTTDRITVSWAAVPGADSYRVYGRTAGSELLLATVGVPTRTVADGKMWAAHSRTVADIACTAQGATITSATAAFTADDVGRRIVIPGQGYLGFDLDTTIAAVLNATTATLAYSPNFTATAQTGTISSPALTVLESATAAFASTDVGKGVLVNGAGSSGGILYAQISQYLSATRVVLDAPAATTVSGASTSVTGGTVPTSFVDDGSLTPAGGLPGNPPGQTARTTPWVSQTADVAQWQDNSATPVTTQRINRNGRLIFKLGTAPALADLADGEATLWTDTDGTLKVTTRVAGALRTGSVAVA